MKKELVENVQRILKESYEAYVRLIREYGIVNHTTATNARVRSYIKDIKETVFDDINRMVQVEKEDIIKAVKVKPGIRDITGEIKRNSELVLMKSAIDGADNKQLIELASKYANTEYEEEFRVILQPRIKELTDNRSAERIKNIEIINEIMATLDKLPEEAAKEINSLDSIIEDVRSLLYFNDNNFNIAAQMNEDGRIIHGNWQTRNLEFDIKDANEGFNPLGEANLEPLTVTEKLGTKYYKTVNYKFDWEEN